MLDNALMAINLRQQRFIDHFLICGNASEAYLVAGYKCRSSSVRSNASQLLTNTDIAAEISRRRAVLDEQARKEVEVAARRLRMTAEDVLEENAIIGSSSIAHFIIEFHPAERGAPVGQVLSHGLSYCACLRIRAGLSRSRNRACNAPDA